MDVTAARDGNTAKQSGKNWGLHANENPGTPDPHQMRLLQFFPLGLMQTGRDSQGEAN